MAICVCLCVCAYLLDCVHMRERGEKREATRGNSLRWLILITCLWAASAPIPSPHPIKLQACFEQDPVDRDQLPVWGGHSLPGGRSQHGPCPRVGLDSEDSFGVLRFGALVQPVWTPSRAYCFITSLAKLSVPRLFLLVGEGGC